MGPMCIGGGTNNTIWGVAGPTAPSQEGSTQQMERGPQKLKYYWPFPTSMSGRGRAGKFLPRNWPLAAQRTDPRANHGKTRPELPS